MSRDGGDIVGRRLTIRGLVQGVGYRAWTEAEATKLGLRGWVRNCRDGTVEAVAIGDQRTIDSLIAACRHGPPHASVDAVDVSEAEDDGSTGFRCVASL